MSLGSRKKLGLLLSLFVSWAGCGPPPKPRAARPATHEATSRSLEEFRRGFARDYPLLVREASSQPKLGAMACAAPSATAYRHPQVLCSAYGKLARWPLLEGAGQPVKDVLAALASLERHAFADKKLPARVVEHRRAIELAERHHGEHPAPSIVAPLAPTPLELERLRPVARRLPTGAEGGRLLRYAISKRSPIPRLQRAFSQQLRRRRRALEARSRLELRLADALVSYAAPFEKARLDAVRWARTPKPPKGQPAASQAASRPVDPIPDVAAYLEGRLRASLVALHRAAKQQGGMLQQLRKLGPQHPQYGRLLVALARYRQLAARGGWSPVARTTRLRRGKRHRRVLALEQRLAAEGYFNGSADGRVDVALLAAVGRFKEAHRLFAKGLDRNFWRALNRPIGEKIAALVRELRRWRRSKTQVSTTYVLVNLPSFHLELRKGPRRLFRQAVVVGRHYGTKCDEETESKVLAFATPELDARIEHLVFSPYWNVTKEIKQKELDPERGKDPLFYEKHGYDIVRPGTPHEWVREMPSPKNALGFVKFIFNNPYSVFVHDTPEKGLFARPFRAFSHGCMRLRSPRELARLLLQNDGQYDATRFSELYRKWRSMSFKELQEEWDEELYERRKKTAEELVTKVVLKRAVPIHVEYHTVWIGEEGRPRFLRDLYRRDDPRPRVRCIPESKRARRGFMTLLMRVLTLEVLATQIGPKAQAAFARAGTLTIPTRRWKKRIKRLGEFVPAHANLVASVRREQQTLNAKLEARRGRWNDRLVEEAVRIERLVESLRAMQHGAKRAIAYIEKLTAKKGP